MFKLNPPHRLLFLLIGAILVLGTSCAPQPAIPTLAQLPSVTPAKAAPDPATATPAATSPRAELPPTWTITPTHQASPTPVASPTEPVIATLVPTRQLTLNPQALSNTYWSGDGTGGMMDYQIEDGTFLRFTVFPVNIWVGVYGGASLTPAQEAAVENALTQIAPVVPVQRVANRAFAHLTIWLMNDAEFEQNAGCDNIHTAIGCASPVITDIGILLNTIWLRTTDAHFDATLLHEILHGLGILVHSPDPADLMYAYQADQPARLSERDLNTLRALYSAPAFAPRAN